MDKIFKSLVLGFKSDSKNMNLKYKKYKSLDATNVKQITANKVELEEIPYWLKDCKNLKILSLEQNGVKTSMRFYKR